MTLLHLSAKHVLPQYLNWSFDPPSSLFILIWNIQMLLDLYRPTSISLMVYSKARYLALYFSTYAHCTTPISTLILSNSATNHLNADDTQLFITYFSKQFHHRYHQISRYHISWWLSFNLLFLFIQNLIHAYWSIKTTLKFLTHHSYFHLPHPFVQLPLCKESWLRIKQKYVHNPQHYSCLQFSATPRFQAKVFRPFFSQFLAMLHWMPSILSHHMLTSFSFLFVSLAVRLIVFFLSYPS